MSQFWVGLNSGNIPPSIPTSFVTDVNSPSVPIANVENVLGGTTTANDVDGIRTDGSSGSNTLTVQLTNRINGNTITSDGAGQTQSFLSFSLGVTPGTYQFVTNLVAYNVTSSLSASYQIISTFRTDGAVATLINLVSLSQENEEGAMTGVAVTMNPSGNTSRLTVTGIAGQVIDWLAVETYIFVS